MNASVALIDDKDELAQARWSELLADISHGVSLEDAMLKHGMTSKEVDNIARNPLEAQRYVDARLAGKRHRFPIFAFEEINARIARGVPVLEAIVQVRGNDPEEIGLFFELVESDPALGAAYARAMGANALRTDATIEADAADSSNDIIDNGMRGKIGNMAAVGRSKLSVETKFKRMGSWHERFSEKKANVAVQVNIDYAGTLEAAQQRAKLRGAKPKITKQVIDAAFADVKPEAAPVRPVRAAPDIHSFDTYEPAETAPVEPTPIADAAPAEPLPTIWKEET